MIFQLQLSSQRRTEMWREITVSVIPYREAGRCVHRIKTTLIKTTNIEMLYLIRTHTMSLHFLCIPVIPVIIHFKLHVRIKKVDTWINKNYICFVYYVLCTCINYDKCCFFCLFFFFKVLIYFFPFFCRTREVRIKPTVWEQFQQNAAWI